MRPRRRFDGDSNRVHAAKLSDDVGARALPLGRSFLIVLVTVTAASCGSPGPAEPTSPSQSASSSASIAAGPLDVVWSTGPVPLEDIRVAMVAAGLDEGAVEGWIEDQHSPPEFTFELRFDSPDFSHSRVDAHFPLGVDESGTYVLRTGSCVCHSQNKGMRTCSTRRSPSTR